MRFLKRVFILGAASAVVYILLMLSLQGYYSDPKTSIPGAWQVQGSSSVYLYLPDGTLVQYANRQMYTGTYTFTNTNTLSGQANNLAGGWQGTYKVEIIGNTMTLTATNGAKATLDRLSAVTAANFAGSWQAKGDTEVDQYNPDGTWTLTARGKTFQGTYTIVDGFHVREILHGETGTDDLTFFTALSGDSLVLIQPDGIRLDYVKMK